MLLSLAVDHRHANVATRERFHLTAARLAALYGAPDPAGPPRGARRRRPLGAEAAGRPPADCVAVATCNRSEVYAWAPAAAGRAAASPRRAHRRIAPAEAGATRGEWEATGVTVGSTHGTVRCSGVVRAGALSPGAAH